MNTHLSASLQTKRRWTPVIGAALFAVVGLAAPVTVAAMTGDDPPTVAPPVDALQTAAVLLDGLARDGTDASCLWGLPTDDQVDRAVRTYEAVERWLSTRKDTGATLLRGRAAAIASAALASRGRAHAEVVERARTLLESIEGPSTAAEALRRVTLAGALLRSEPSQVAVAEPLLRGVLDLPSGDDPATQVPRATRLEALLGVIGLSSSAEFAARMGPLALRDQPGDLARLLVAEAQTRRMYQVLIERPSPPDSPPAQRRWTTVLAPLWSVRGVKLGGGSVDETEMLLLAKAKTLCARAASLDDLPPLGLLARGDEASLGALLAREDAGDLLGPARLALAEVLSDGVPDRMSLAIGLLCADAQAEKRLKLDTPSRQRAMTLLDALERRATRIVRAGSPDEGEGLAAIDAFAQACLAVIALHDQAPPQDQALRDTAPAQRARLVRAMATLGQAKGPEDRWFGLALSTLRGLGDDPRQGERVTQLVDQLLKARYPQKQPRTAEVLSAMNADLTKVRAIAVLASAPERLAPIEAELAEAQLNSGDPAQIANASSTLDRLIAMRAAPSVPGDLDRLQLLLAQCQRRMGQPDRAAATLAQITDRYDEPLAGRPRAFWLAWAERLEITLDQDPSAGTAARVRLHIRQLRTIDPTLGDAEARKRLDALDGRAAAIR